jgi:hypothetical protein
LHWNQTQMIRLISIAPSSDNNHHTVLQKGRWISMSKSGRDEVKEQHTSWLCGLVLRLVAGCVWDRGGRGRALWGGRAAAGYRAGLVNLEIGDRLPALLDQSEPCLAIPMAATGFSLGSWAGWPDRPDGVPATRIRTWELGRYSENSCSISIVFISSSSVRKLDWYVPSTCTLLYVYGTGTACVQIIFFPTNHLYKLLTRRIFKTYE